MEPQMNKVNRRWIIGRHSTHIKSIREIMIPAAVPASRGGNLLLRALLVLLPAAPVAMAATAEGPPARAERAAASGWQARLDRAARTPEAWRARAAEIRLRVLVAAGLWPPFDRPHLQPVVFGRIERDGYTIEQVHFETWPGFHLTGNLYRPRKTAGPFPAVVSPHGHWKEGRFHDAPEGSVPARAINLARLGFVVFSYDMVGYGDCRQIPHRGDKPFGDAPWGLSLLGLQLWNSLRAVDFLCALPDVDPKRIGATGASGGATQTFLLAAVDDRIACAAPVCMVAGVFQGGCQCENAPLLRIDLNNVEIAAAAAPRPLLLVSATGDWTKDNPTLEAPAIRKVYERLGASDRFACVQFKAGHNYNVASRQAVYDWFLRWLLLPPPPAGSPPMEVHGLPEAPYEVEKRETLAVFGPGHPIPPGAVDAAGLGKHMKDTIRAQLEALRPRDAASLVRFRDLMGPAFRHALTVEWPELREFVVAAATRGSDDAAPSGAPPLVTVCYTRHATVAEWRMPPDAAAEAPRPPRPATLILDETGPGGDRQAPMLVQRLAERGESGILLSVRAPERPEGIDHGTKEQREHFPLTYYTTPLAGRVQGVVAAVAYLSARRDVSGVRLVGIGRAGVPVLLARAVMPDRVKIDRTIVDVAGLDDASEAGWSGDLAHPGILRLGGLRAAGALAAAGPGDLVIHNTQSKFDAAWIRDAYKAAGREGALTVSESAWPPEKILGALKE
jgi:dienelactone hydrolase